MNLFEMRDLREAIEHAKGGGQALHLMSGGWPVGPECFRKAKEFAHLFDQDPVRLFKTAKRLGVRRPVISRRGEPGQHVDLCGRPLERARLELA